MRTLGAVAAAHVTVSIPPITSTVTGAGKRPVSTIAAAAFDAGVILFDDFTGTTLNRGTWTVYDRISDQANSELNCCVSANVSVSGGTLKILSKFEDHVCRDAVAGVPDATTPQTMHYTSGQIAQALPSFLYGTVDVRAKIAGGTGLWPCIWMLGYQWQPSQPYTANTPEHNWPHDGWCELDIAEFMNGTRDEVNCNLHWQVPGGTNLKPLPFDATTRFMVYRLVWAAGSLTWLVDAEDGVGFRVLRTITGAGNVPNVPMYLIIHTAIGGFAGGTPNPATFPQTMEVDYARITV